VLVLDASHLARSLFLFSQIAETGLPIVVALNQVDVLTAEGRVLNLELLAQRLGVPVVPTNARKRVGLDQLRAAIPNARRVPRPIVFGSTIENALVPVEQALEATFEPAPVWLKGEALRLVTQARSDDPFFLKAGERVQVAVQAARDELAAVGVDYESFDTEHRYAWARDVEASANNVIVSTEVRRSERIDQVLTHRFFGPLIFVAVMGALFQSVYSWAEPFMGAIESLTGWAGTQVANVIGPGTLTDLLVDGVIAGVGNVLVFLPQIAILFLLLTILEDLGYLARAAFLMPEVPRRTSRAPPGQPGGA
jgi:ferrous iron transport protein B